MIREILYKWFGIEDKSCPACEILQEQLRLATEEKRQLLDLIIEKNRPELPMPIRETAPIRPAHIPWRTRQQMLEQEDRETAKILKEKNEQLEEEIGVKNGSSR